MSRNLPRIEIGLRVVQVLVVQVLVVQVVDVHQDIRVPRLRLFATNELCRESIEVTNDVR